MSAPALYGLTPAAVTRALEALSKRPTGLSNHRWEPTLRCGGAPVGSGSLHPPDFGNLLIATPSGYVPLAMFAEVAETDGPNQIQREGTQRRIVVYGNGDGRRDMAAIAADIRRILSELDLPRGYSTSLEGTFQAQEEATWRIGALSLVSLSAIFIVLVQPLSFGHARLDHHGRYSACVDRQRGCSQCRRTTVVGRLDDRIHHAGRHIGPQRHPQDFALHQSRAS